MFFFQFAGGEQEGPKRGLMNPNSGIKKEEAPITSEKKLIFI